MTRIPVDEPNADQPDADVVVTDAPSPGPDDRPGGGGASNELIELRGERDQLYERLARATAEYKNSQKRLEAEFDQRIQYANSTLIKSLLPTIDNFERALAQDAAKVDPATIMKGMQIVHDQLMVVLKQQKVEEIAPRAGDAFNPTLHEAVMQQASDQYKEPAVTQLFEKGYSLSGRTIRPAKVAVSAVG